MKTHFLHLPHEFFRKNLGTVSEEQSKRFYQDIQAMKEKYQGVWIEVGCVVFAGCYTVMIQLMHTKGKRMPSIFKSSS